MAAKQKSFLEIEGRKVPVSNLDKVFYPEAGFTKADVIDYYVRIAPLLLPHLKNRAVTLKRYPEGVEGGFFYEKKCPPYRPGWIKTAAVWSKHNQADIHYCVIDNLASLVWAVNLADLEIHTFLWRIQDVHRPTTLVFDLDPGAPADILDCAEVALRLEKIFFQWKLKAFAKTSGSKGLQVYVPLNVPTHFDRTGPFAKALAVRLEAEQPERVVSKMTKILRKGKVFIDWSQNDEHKTTVCVYSLRAKPTPTVSMPVEWPEVRKVVKKGDAELLQFDFKSALARAKRRGDLFAPVLELKQRLPKAI